MIAVAIITGILGVAMMLIGYLEQETKIGIGGIGSMLTCLIFCLVISANSIDYIIVKDKITGIKQKVEVKHLADHPTCTINSKVYNAD